MKEMTKQEGLDVTVRPDPDVNAPGSCPSALSAAHHDVDMIETPEDRNICRSSWRKEVRG